MNLVHGLMVRSFFFRLFGLALIVIAAIGVLWDPDEWQAHAFYTGLALFLAGQVLEHLANIRHLGEHDVHAMRLHPAMEHLVAMRTLLDEMNLSLKQRISN